MALQENNLTIILPAYNEEKAIGRVIDEIKSLPINCEILVVDNMSTDNTYKIASRKGARVVEVLDRGKGNAMGWGFKLARAPYVIMVNSDYTYPAKYIQTIYNLLKMDYYGVVIGCRQFKEKGSMSSANTFGNFCLSSLASILYRYRIDDVCSGMWGFRKEVLDKFDIMSKGFTLEADLFTNAIKNKCRISQIPIGYRPRLDGSIAKLKIWDGFKIGWFLLKRRFRYQR